MDVGLGFALKGEPSPIRPVVPRRMPLLVAERQPETLEILKFGVCSASMITIAQIRAARGLLKWTQAALAHRAAISAVTLNMIENEAVRPRPTTLAAIERALEGAGVQMLEEDGIGVGVRFALKR